MRYKKWMGRYHPKKWAIGSISISPTSLLKIFIFNPLGWLLKQIYNRNCCTRAIPIQPGPPAAGTGLKDMWVRINPEHIEKWKMSQQLRFWGILHPRNDQQKETPLDQLNIATGQRHSTLPSTQLTVGQVTCPGKCKNPYTCEIQNIIIAEDLSYNFWFKRKMNLKNGLEWSR